MEKSYDFQDVLSFLEKENLLGKQVFDTENVIGEPVKTIYEKDGVKIGILDRPKDESSEVDIRYLEIFGLTNEDFNYLEDLFLDTIDENNIFGAVVKDLALMERRMRENELS